MPPLQQSVILPNQYQRIWQSPSVYMSRRVSFSNRSYHHCITAGTSLNCLDIWNWRGSSNQSRKTQPAAPGLLMSYFMTVIRSRTLLSFLVITINLILFPECPHRACGVSAYLQVCMFTWMPVERYTALCYTHTRTQTMRSRWNWDLRRANKVWRSTAALKQGPLQPNTAVIVNVRQN